MAHFVERIAHSLIFGQKTNNSLRNQMSDFPALLNLQQLQHRRCETVDGIQETKDGRWETGDERWETGDRRWETEDGRWET